MCKSITYQRVKSKLDMWTWELNFRWSVDDTTRAIEAQKEVTRWTNILWQFPAINIERSYKALEMGEGELNSLNNY